MRDRHRSHRSMLRAAEALFGVALLMTWASPPPHAQTKSDAQIQADVQRHVRDLLGSSRVTVMVADHVVTLDGTVPNLWTKLQLIERSRKTTGVERVDSTLQVAQGENDTRLAEEVAKRLRSYPLYTVFDYIDGRVLNGVVTLTGAVNSTFKQDELAERIEKTAGVRELKNELKILPVSRSDDQIRIRIANLIYSDPLFDNYSRALPPIHIVVEHGHVTLFGIVSSQIEKRKADTVARGIPGVFSVDDRIQVTTR